MRVVITGLGVISSIAQGRENFWRALETGKNGAGPITQFDTTGFSVRIAAEVRDFNPEDWMDKKEARRNDRVVQFAVAAADLAVKESGLDLEKIDHNRLGAFVGSGEGGIITTHENYAILRDKGPSRVSPFFVPMMLPNMPAALVAIKFRAKGPNMAVVTACASATHSMGEAYYTIVRGDADIILAGGSEAPIAPVAVAGFASMKALSTRNDEPLKASRPFDVNRDGFLMGEGAGILVFENLEHALARGAKIYAEVTGYGSTCDAYHITAPDPDGDGSVRAMKIAVEKSGWQLNEVDLINAHGTSTPLNDKMESASIRKLFGSHTDKILVNSTKSMVGHALGAAGALETIAAIQSLEEGIVHPTINCDEQDPECVVNVVKETTKSDVKKILINNFGFGGHNGVLAISSYEG